MAESLLPTTVVGSYPQPDWLIDRDKLTHLPPVRVRAQELWRVPDPWLEQAQDDATVLAIRDMERAGIDIITDGEIRRESYSNRFATALSGVDLENPATVRGRSKAFPARPRCTSASATPMSPATSRAAIRFCPNLPLRRRNKSRSRRRSPISISPRSTVSATRR